MTDKEKQIFDKYGNYNFPTDIKQSGQNIATTQIEEMAKVTESVKLYGIDNYGRKISHASILELAKYLVEQGYRKIPEGSVVLSMEEFDEDYVTKQDLDYWKYKAEILGNKLKQARNETAREILKWLVDTGMINIAPDTTKMYFKEQFGVEVEK